MSIKSKVLAAAAALTLVSGVGVTGALTAGSATAATPSCGKSCINLINTDFTGIVPGGPLSPLDVFRQSQKVGQPIILFRSSNSDPALDFTIAAQGLVSDFLAAGLVSTAVALHYGGLGHFVPPFTQIIKGVPTATCTAPGTTPIVLPAATGPFAGLCSFPDFEAFEIEYAPFGVDSGLCVGVAATAFQGEGVTLQPCGVSSKTVWIFDSFDTQLPTNAPGVPLINGSDTNFSHPFVLTYPAGANPVDKPRTQVTVTNLTGFAQPGNGGVVPVISSVNSNQLWLAAFGVLP